MAILAANCPCCGRDIGFEEDAKECTCIFCGAKLITATLVKERVDPNQVGAGYEQYRRGDAADRNYWNPGGRRPVINPEGMRGFEDYLPREPIFPVDEPAETPKQNTEAAPPPVPEKKEQEELTEEEIRLQLMRKAEFKQELRDVVKEIDDLRAKRERFSSQLKTCKLLMIIGLVLIGAAAAIMILFDGVETVSNRFVVAGSLTGLGLVALILSEVRKNGVKKQQKENEKTIGEKKEKRDVLIGRLNKINKHLHIHDDEQ